MVAPCLPAAAPKAATSSRSATRRLSATQSNSFSKSSRILKSGEFRRVYDQGKRIPGRLFVAFCLERDDSGGARIGLTVPRSLGHAVARNRIKRRLREAARLRLHMLGGKWDIVVNPRRSAADADFADLEREVEKLFLRCGQ